MTQLAAVLALAILLLLGLLIARCSSLVWKRRLISGLILYLLAVHAAVTIKDRDLWPFSNYRLLDGLAPSNDEDWRIEFYGVDSNGREWLVDPLSWSPASDWVMQQWFIRFFRPLPEARRAEVLDFLFRKAESARSRLASGRRIGNESLLGDAAAPYWLPAARPSRFSPEPFRKLRVYEVWFLPSERVSGQRRERRRDLVGEHGR